MGSYLEDLFKGRRPLALSSIPFPAELSVLMLGPHPDDFDAVAVTMRLFQRNGNPLAVAVVRSGSGVEDGYASPPTLEHKAAIREEEQRKSCAHFGLPEEALAFLALEQDDEGQPLDSPANLETLRRTVLDLHPDFVFLPHGSDTNTGHQRMSALFRRIAAEAGYPLAALLNRDPKTTRIRVDAFTPFGPDEADWKRQLLLFHDSQHRRNLNTRRQGFDERILNFNRRTAQEIPGAGAYAEAFELEFFGLPPPVPAAPPQKEAAPEPKKTAPHASKSQVPPGESGSAP